MKFELGSREVDGVKVIAVAGEADSREAHELAQGLLKATAKGVTAVLLDLSSARWLSGPCLRTVVTANERLEAEGRLLALCGLNPKVEKALRIADMRGMLPVFSDHGEALAWLRESVHSMRAATLAGRLLQLSRKRGRRWRPRAHSGDAVQRSAMAARLLQSGETEVIDS